MAYFGGELSSRRNFPMTEPKNVEIFMANPTISLDFPILVMHIAIFRLCIMHYALCMHFPHVPSLFPTKTHALWDNQLYSKGF